MNRTRMITIGGTLMCALGIGFFMQRTAPQAPIAPQQMEPVARADFKPLSEPALPSMAVAQAPSEDLIVPETTTPPAPETIVDMIAPVDPDPVVEALPEPEPEPQVEMAALSDDTVPEMPAEADLPQTNCAIDARGSVDAGAMVKLEVSAPCFPNERIVVHHNGMMFTAVTDGDGMMTTLVPALSETAVLIVEFANGEGAVATADVSSLIFYDRVVLQWSGNTGFELHAREYGADYGSDGHVWSESARQVTAAALGQGGFMTRLGDGDTLAPRIAEVYTFPSRTATQDGEIAISVEAQVTAENCGQDIEAQSLELQDDGSLRTQYLTLAVPECESIGGFLVLNNLVDDLKIAAN